MLCIPFGHVVAAAINSKRRVDVLVGEELSRNNWAAWWDWTQEMELYEVWWEGSQPGHLQDADMKSV
ncbi:hypothetical protein DY000_02004755 [Brassica cretica]|uniref:Uncharacterized protein n=1 Tax=Brassica cretica TaxID=69181 RepID=A0ABQ7C9B0_BRACR|nr:hypothetical protein DY000_02004755 [Brassica cretica]